MSQVDFQSKKRRPRPGLRSSQSRLRAVRLLPLREGPLKPSQLAVALEAENVGTHTIEEVPVVTHYECAALVLLQGLLQAAQRLNVEVICRLVQH